MTETQGEGVLSFQAWPTHVGVVDLTGHEPWQHTDYHREQLHWEMIDGVLTGRIRKKISVPAGEYLAMVFTYHPTSPLLAAPPSRWQHPLRFDGEAEIEIYGIVQEDFTP